jgi:SAM-dependent methyltransferase
MQTRPKPSHHSAAYGAWFKDPLVAEAYPSRPTYPDEVFSLLTSLIPGRPEAAAVLDLGAGTGDLARRLAPLVARVDAVDASSAMMERGKALSGGNHPRLKWILGTAEEAALSPPYGLASAGESLHWMDWDVVLPRVAQALAPGAVLAIVNRNWDGPPALRDRLIPIFTRYSPVPDYRPYDLIAELTSRGLFREVGRQRCGPAPWTPTIADYLECRHSQRGGSRTHMGPDMVAGFDAAVMALLEELCLDGTITQRDGRLQLQVTANVVWGVPAPDDARQDEGSKGNDPDHPTPRSE